MHLAWKPVVALLLAAGLALPATAAQADPAPAIGADVSWPQCGRPLTPGPAFGVVGVNDGTATSTNPCLADQLAWAATATGTGHPAVEVYVNTANPGPGVAAWWPSGDATWRGAAAHSPYGRCTGGATTACSWVYGASLAADDLEVRGVPSGAAARWWLDVETISTYSASTAANRAALEGMTQRFLSAGQRVGLYALDHEFRDRIGDVPTGSVLHPLPTWLAGARDAAHAAEVCTRAPLTGGRVQLVQWVGSDAVGVLDQDLACTALTATPKPRITGTRSAGARLTARPGTWRPGGVHLQYRWTRDGSPIAGADGRTYRVVKRDRAHRIAVVVTGTLTGCSRSVRTSAAIRIR